MNSGVEILDWDSSFFDIKICKVFGNITDSEELSSVINELDSLNIDLCYYSSSLPLKPIQSNSSLLYDIIYVGKKITYVKSKIANVHGSNSIIKFTSQVPSDELLELAIESGSHSRFNIDKNIGRSKFEELYKDWIINSVNKILAKEVFVYVEDQVILGFITLEEKNSRANIGIIAVENNSRGRGIGKSLMLSAENWSANRRHNEIQVVTQAENLPACRLYESCGYQVEKYEYFYHVWKRELLRTKFENSKSSEKQS